MSYLDRPRLTFFGQFTANPSTINNTPANYASPPNLEELEQNELWNPFGTHAFSLNNCAITNLVVDGPAITVPPGAVVSTAQNGVLVDLDTEQQMVSQIIGMRLTVTVGSGSVTGTFVPVNFFDIVFGRSAGQQGDGGASAAYQTVLSDLQWNEQDSPFLVKLKQASPTQLSIRMNVDGFNDGSGATPGPFPNGRVAGTIGPYFDGEPTSFTNARFLRPVPNVNVTIPATTPPTPVSFNYAPAKTDLTRRTLTIDLGNALPTTWVGTDPQSTAPEPTSWTFDPPLQLAIVSAGPNGLAAGTVIGDIDSSEAAYEKTAFVQEFDITAVLPPNGGPLPATGVCVQQQGGPSLVVMAENPNGAYINADQYVFRMNPGDTAQVTMWANIFEQPAAGAAVMLYPSLTGLQSVPGIAVGTPPNGVLYPANLTTGSDGRATFTLTANDPGQPRGAIDGQIYGIGWTWAQDLVPDPNSFLSVHVFGSVPVPDAPTWWQDVFPILNQYAYLYWKMWWILKINDYDTVVANIVPIVQRLTYPEDSPGYMPITRELSADKLAILLKWAKNPVQGPVPVPPPTPFQPPPQTTSGSAQ